MDNSLQRYVGQPVRKAPRHQRPVVADGTDIYNRTRMAALKADASVALAGHIMEELCDLHSYARTLAKEDPALQMLVGDIFGTTVEQVKKVQRNLFNPWGF